MVRAWQGLGYYSRARNLHQGVKEVVETYGGQVPRTRKEMESLKGVGSYTAGAVLSIAYNLREPAVDGNVLRVYARLYNIHKDILGTVGKKAITTWLKRLCHTIAQGISTKPLWILVPPFVFLKHLVVNLAH